LTAPAVADRSPAPSRGRIAVVVPATDRPRHLRQCLAALAGGSLAPDELAVIMGPRADGPARARNRGAALTDADVVVFVDADVELHRDALARIAAAFEGDPGLVGVFGSYDADPAASGAVSGFRNLLHHHVHQTSPGPARTFWAGIGAVRRSAFEAVGGFDEGRFREASVEDVELGMRLIRAGRVDLDPAILGTHLKRWTLAGTIATDFLRRGVPWGRLLIARRTAPAVLNLGWAHRASALASLAVAAGVVRRRGGTTGFGLAVLVALNRRFYVKLLRRRGPAQAFAGVGLHVLHHLTSVAALGTAAAAELLDG
jgi:glycosyltransferase involved in cell wall biosynthesis